MTTITNLRHGAIGTDLQPPITSLRRDEDRFPPYIWEVNLTRARRRADQRFCLIFAACVLLAFAIIVVPLLLAGNGGM